MMPPLTPWLLDQIRDGNAMLFLGAGASYGARGRNGEKPLSADELRDKLCDKFLGGDLKDRTLSEVAEYAKNESSLHEVQRLIFSLFEPLRPASHQLLIPSFRWHAIITTNYDFIVERAYADSKSALQKPIRISQDGDASRADLGNPRNVPFLKLHGCLSAITDDSPPLILSTEEYSRHRYNRERVFGLFTDWATAHPIIFCGYRIGDPNIQQILFDLGDGSINRPLYAVIDPFLTNFDLRYWQSRRFVPHRSTFEDFLVALDLQIPSSTRVLALLRSAPTSSIQSHIIRGKASEELLLYIDQELQHVREGMPTASVSARDFFKGLSGSWDPIARDLDVERRFVDEFLLAAVLEPPTDNRLEAYLLKGHAGSGKSIALRRAAWNAAVRHNALVFWLVHGGQIRIDPIRELCNLTNERIYIFIEDAIQELNAIRALSTTASRESLPVTLVFGARTNEWNIAEDVHEQVITNDYELSDLNNREISQLLLRLKVHGCLGLLESLTEDERHDHFRLTAQRQLLVALHEATSGKTFEEIVLDEYANLVPAEAQSLYLDVATFHRFRVPLRAGLVSRLSGINLEYFQTKLLGPLEHVVKVAYDWRSRDYAYETRHPVIADLVCQQVLRDPAERANQVVRLVRLMNVDYQSDQVAFENLIRGRELAELFDDRVFADRIFLAAAEAAASESHIAHQRAVFELNHRAGNIHVALEAVKRAEDSSTSGRARSSIRHTRALALRKLALELENSLQRDRVRSEAKEIVRRLIRHPRATSHPYHTLALLLLDDIKERMASLAEVSPNEVDLLQRQMSSLIGEVEKIVLQGLQKFPGQGHLLSVESQLATILNDHPRAIEVLKRALETNPGDGFVAIRLARHYRNKRLSEDAKGVLIRCLENNPTSREVHVQLGRLLGEEDEYGQRNEIRNHLRRGFTSGDANYDAQFWYARHEFLYGDIEVSRTIFSSLANAKVPPGTKQQVRGRVRNEGGSPRRFRGIVRRKMESYCFVACSDLRDNVFMHPRSFIDEQWKTVTGISELEFELVFSFRGPVGDNVVVLS